MKNFINVFFYLILYLLLFVSVNHAQFSYQFHFNQPQEFTNSYYDINPTFGRRDTYLAPFLLVQFDFIAFERKLNVNDLVSQICVAKVDSTGLNSVTYITNDGYINRNPSLACYFGSDNSVYAALIVWESVRRGRSDIYGRVYFYLTGWGKTFPIDTTNSNKNNPNLFAYSGTLYDLVYEKEGDIIFIEITNPGIFVHSNNLTSSDTSYCSKPVVSRFGTFGPPRLYVSYERNESDNQKAIYFRNQNYRSGDTIYWSIPDTVYATGDNRNADMFSANSMIFTYSFENYLNGKWTPILVSYSPFFLPTNPDRNSTQISFFLYGDFFDFYVRHFVCREQSEDSIKIKLFGFVGIDDSITIGNTSSNKKVTMNNSLNSANWVIYDNVSGTNSSLYGVRIANDIITETQNSESFFPKKFTLSQNYPNPFNPLTNLGFGISHLGFVSLKVYDITGKEVATLVNEKLSAGSYEVEFDGSNFSSGIYFYKLSAGNFSEVKRMILLK